MVNTFLYDQGFESAAEGIIVLVSRAGIVMHALRCGKRFLWIHYGIYRTLENKHVDVFTDEAAKSLAFELLVKIGQKWSSG